MLILVSFSAFKAVEILDGPFTGAKAAADPIREAKIREVFIVTIQVDYINNCEYNECIGSVLFHIITLVGFAFVRVFQSDALWREMTQFYITVG